MKIYFQHTGTKRNTKESPSDIRKIFPNGKQIGRKK